MGTEHERGRRADREPSGREPSGREPSGREPSGRIVLRLPRTLHAQLADAADAEGVSLNQFMVAALAGAVQWRHASAMYGYVRGEQHQSAAPPTGVEQLRGKTPGPGDDPSGTGA